MARGRRRVVADGGGRGRGRAFVPGSAENATASAGFAVTQAQPGTCRTNAGQKRSRKRVIESSDVDPEQRAIGIDSTDSGEMQELGLLHEAASIGRIDRCKYLVEDLGFDINAEANNDSGMTPLACAVLHGKAIAVRYFLDNGADPDKKDIIGFTPLHHATKEGNDGLVRLLVSKGASVNASSSEGTPLHMAASHGNSAIVQILLQNNADSIPMTAAVLCAAPGRISESSALKCMKLLVKAGADFNYANPDTPLVIAASKDLSECVKYLLEVGADANIPINHGGITPIEIAADSGRRELVEILFPHTYAIQSVSNWSVEGIIAHAKSKQLKEKIGCKRTKVSSIRERMHKPKAAGRPPTQYFLFLQDFRKGLKNQLTVEISKEASEKWKTMTDSEKAPYKSRYNELMRARRNPEAAAPVLQLSSEEDEPMDVHEHPQAAAPEILLSSDSEDGQAYEHLEATSSSRLSGPEPSSCESAKSKYII